MKQEVTITIPGLQLGTGGTTGGVPVKLTRAQVEKALDELNKPEFRTGDIVKRKGSEELFTVVTGMAAKYIYTGVGPRVLGFMDKPVSMVSFEDGGTNTYEAAKALELFELVYRHPEAN